MIFLYLALIIGSLLFGVFEAQKLTKRVKFFDDFVEFLTRYSLNLSYKQDSLPEVIKNFGEERSGDFSLFIREAHETNNLDYLKPEERKFVENAILSLGNADQITEENKVSGLLTQSVELQKKIKSYKDKYAGIYIKLSFLVGLLLVILLL